ncbi:MAG TPA: hypothetical protein VGA80_15400 [Flavobacteriaceae bacterium]
MYEIIAPHGKRTDQSYDSYINRYVQAKKTMSRTKRVTTNIYSILDNKRIIYDLKFDPIKNYLDRTQEMIISQETQMLEKFNKWNLEHGNDPEKPDAFDIYETEILNSSAFPDILNKSIYLTIYSMFEIEFFKLCEWCKHIGNFNLGPKDLSERNYISQCRKYIIKVLDVNLDSLNEKWSEIGKYQLLRNAIAHNNGILKNLSDDNLLFIDKTFGISVDNESGEIQIESIESLKNLIDILVNFLNDVIEQIIGQKEKAST